MDKLIPKPGRIAARFVLSICLIYLFALAAASVLLWNFSDRWWPATALSFAPLWTLATPLIFLVPLALIFHRTSLLTLAAAGAVLAWPIMGLQIRWPATATDNHAPRVRVMTCNMHRQQMNVAEFRAVL